MKCRSFSHSSSGLLSALIICTWTHHLILVLHKLLNLQSYANCWSQQKIPIDISANNKGIHLTRSLWAVFLWTGYFLNGFSRGFSLYFQTIRPVESFNNNIRHSEINSDPNTMSVMYTIYSEYAVWSSAGSAAGRWRSSKPSRRIYLHACAQLWSECMSVCNTSRVMICV